jgi:TonB family protein
MKRLLCFLSITLLASCLITPAHAQATAHELLPNSSDLNVSVDMLSDTAGINIDAYMRTLISDLKKNWMPLVTEEANQPLKSQQETLITLSIAPDGHIAALRMEDSTHDVALDKAAWNATKATTYSPLPAEMKAPNLKLRVHFTVN